jgi:hypothetical protein
MGQPPRSRLVGLFKGVTIAPGGDAIGPAAGFDLTGHDKYRLSLRLDGAPDAGCVINERYRPAGGVRQLNVEIAGSRLDGLGNLNFRGRFEAFGPKAVFIRILNRSAEPMTVNGSLYAGQL